MEALKKAGEEWMARSLPSLADDNLNYDLWRIGDLSIMIRSKLHGYIKTPEVPTTSYIPRGLHTCLLAIAYPGQQVHRD